METVIWCILLFITGSCAIFFYREWRELSGIVVNKEDFMDGAMLKQVEDAYGSIVKFVEAHNTDFDIFRSNTLVFIARLTHLRDGIKKVLPNIKDEDFKATLTVIKDTLDKQIEDMTNFLEDELKAHHPGTESITNILEELSDSTKEHNFF
ncbi:MAG: hypothetical protein J6T15_04750 [Bacilli bacterium]|nr:hypothetical protein [Bacilli bacterium]